jgi:predicted ATPase
VPKGEAMVGGMNDPEVRSAVIRTPDYRLRVFVSSTLRELAEERDAVRHAILQLRLAPVMFELGARPHPADDLYQAYLAQSHVFIGIYWQSYGWVAPEKKLSGLEDEYNLSRAIPRLLYIKSPAPDREPALTGLLDRIRDENAGCYKSFATADELRELVENDLALLLSERFEAAGGRGLPGEAVGEHPLTNVPFPRNPLIGREHELRTGCDLLLRADVALVTLTGPGGSGKSRLGIEIALEVRDRFADGVYLVGLDVITDPDLVIPTIARILGVPEPTDGTTVDEVLKASACGKRLLLLLDNFEQVIAAAPRIAYLLEGCPHIKMLVTSRAPLRVRAEKELSVPPLALPPAGQVLESEPLSHYAAVQLFIQRAQAAKAGFEVTSENAPAVAEICHRLDGLPLAIELAAARIRMLSPRALLERMEHSFDVLGGGIRDLPERQRTLHAAIDWSHSLLGDEQKRLFRRLGAFVGGWTFEAVDTVCNAEGETPVDIFDGLERLVDLSLVVPPEEAGGELRFRSLETIREFATQRLAEAGEAESTRRLHAEFYATLAEQIEPEVRGSSHAQWADRLDAEYGNVHAALEWSRRHDADLGLRLCAAIWRYWESHSLIGEGRAWLESFVALNPSETAVRARALVALAALACYQGALHVARTRAEEGLSIYRHLDDETGVAHALNELGVIASYQGDYPAAKRSFEQSLAMKRGSGGRRAIANTINNLGLIAGYQGDYQGAYARHTECLAMYRALEEKLGVAVALGNLGHDAMHLGRLDDARELQIESTRLFHEIGDKDGLAECFERLAMLANANRDFERAARWFGVADVLRSEVATVLEVANQREYDSEFEVTRARLGAAAFDLVLAEGQRMPLDEAMAQAVKAG